MCKGAREPTPVDVNANVMVVAMEREFSRVGVAGGRSSCVRTRSAGLDTDQH